MQLNAQQKLCRIEGGACNCIAYCAIGRGFNVLRSPLPHDFWKPKESEMAVEIDEATAKMHAESVRSNARLFCEAVQAARNAGLHVEIEIEDSGDAPVIVIDVWQPR